MTPTTSLEQIHLYQCISSQAGFRSIDVDLPTIAHRPNRTLKYNYNQNKTQVNYFISHSDSLTRNQQS
jgi:hypothetical protein